MNERTHLFSDIGSCHWPCNSPYPCGRTRYVIFNRAKVQTDGEEDEGGWRTDEGTEDRARAKRPAVASATNSSFTVCKYAARHMSFPAPRCSLRSLQVDVIRSGMTPTYTTNASPYALPCKYTRSGACQGLTAQASYVTTVTIPVKTVHNFIP